MRLIAAAALLLPSLPLILAQGQPFQCRPATADEPKLPFGVLEPFCCAGGIEDRLSVGHNCLVALSTKMQTASGQVVKRCGAGGEAACCTRFVGFRTYFMPLRSLWYGYYTNWADRLASVVLQKYLREIGNPKMSYCDSSFVIRPDPGHLTDIPEAPKPEP